MPLSCLAAVVCLFICVALPLEGQESRVAEYRSKANFLATFPSFVVWPQNAFVSSQAPFLICVRGDFSFGTTLAELARSTSPGGRRVEVRWMHNDQQLHDCQVLFVSRSESKNYSHILHTVQAGGVLTVGETPDFLAAGGIIAFAVEREVLQFEVNLNAADSAGLKISSRLLVLARRVLSKTEAAKG